MNVKLITATMQKAITSIQALDALSTAERAALVHQGAISYNPLKGRYRVTLKGRMAVARNQFDSCFECGRVIIVASENQPSSCCS